MFAGRQESKARKRVKPADGRISACCLWGKGRRSRLPEIWCWQRDTYAHVRTRKEACVYSWVHMAESMCLDMWYVYADSLYV